MANEVTTLKSLWSQISQQRWFGYKGQTIFPTHFDVLHSNDLFEWIELHAVLETSYSKKNRIWHLPVYATKLSFDCPQFIELLNRELQLGENWQVNPGDSTHPTFLSDEKFLKFFPERTDSSQREWMQNLRLEKSELIPKMTQHWRVNQNIYALVWQRLEGQDIWSRLNQKPQELNTLWDECIEHLADLHNWDSPIKEECSFVPKHQLINNVPIKWSTYLAHGDFHFGQLIKTPQGLRSVDWEGAPAINPHWPQADTCALSDLAGLFRSLDYWFRFNNKSTQSKSYWAKAIKLYAKRRQVDITAEFRQTLAWALVARNLYEIDYETSHRPQMAYIAKAGLQESIGFALDINSNL